MRLPLTLRVGVSRRLVAFLVCIHAVALASVVATDLAWPARVLLCCIVLASAAYRYARRGRCEVLILHAGRGGALEIESKIGARATAEIEGPAAFFPGGAVLSMRLADRRLYLPLFADAMTTDDYRHLRVWLGWRTDGRA